MFRVKHAFFVRLHDIARDAYSFTAIIRRRSLILRLNPHQKTRLPKLASDRGGFAHKFRANRPSVIDFCSTSLSIDSMRGSLKGCFGLEPTQGSELSTPASKPASGLLLEFRHYSAIAHPENGAAARCNLTSCGSAIERPVNRRGVPAPRQAVRRELDRAGCSRR